MKKTAIIILNARSKGIKRDIEIPIDITANDLVIALNAAYNLNIDVEDIRNCYLKMENPIALLHGNKMLKDYGIHDCSVINVTD